MLSFILPRFSLLAALCLTLTACQITASGDGFNDRAIRLGSPTETELQNFTAQLTSNAAERQMTPAQASTAFARLGWENLVQKRYDDAAALLNRAWALNPENPSVAAGFALILQYRDDSPERAQQELVTAINLQPNDPALRMHYGRLLADEGLDERAINAFQQALVLNPDTPNVHLALSILYKRLGQYREALKHARIGHIRGEIPDPLWIRALEERLAEES